MIEKERKRIKKRSRGRKEDYYLFFLPAVGLVKDKTSSGETADIFFSKIIFFFSTVFCGATLPYLVVLKILKWKGKKIKTIQRKRKIIKLRELLKEILLQKIIFF